MTFRQAYRLEYRSVTPDELDGLLTARLYVARLGESDVNRWWRTDGILGSDGAFIGPRVLPRTHGTARARIAFAVARHGCQERHPDPGAQHLFQLDPETEDRLDAHLVQRLDAFDWWAAILAQLEKITKDADTGAVLLTAGVVGAADLTQVRALDLGPDGRSLPVARGATPGETFRRLAAGFVRSKPGELAVPYLRQKGRR
jgi:hypothetical protein